LPASRENGVARLRCSICDRWFVASESRFLPFCSNRCKQIDLGRWLKEEYSVPVEDSESETDEVFREDELP
jgi:endogenous inhibitor of DNA gyrase (YacG/DUF329 family)